MSRQTVYDWLEWAQDKYDAAQERFAYGGRTMETMNQYSTLVSALEDAIAYRQTLREERGRASLGQSRGVAAEDMREHAPQRRRAARLLHGERLGRRA